MFMIKQSSFNVHLVVCSLSCTSASSILSYRYRWYLKFTSPYNPWLTQCSERWSAQALMIVIFDDRNLSAWQRGIQGHHSTSRQTLQYFNHSQTGNKFLSPFFLGYCELLITSLLGAIDFPYALHVIITVWVMLMHSHYYKLFHFCLMISHPHKHWGSWIFNSCPALPFTICGF